MNLSNACQDLVLLEHRIWVPLSRKNLKLVQCLFTTFNVVTEVMKALKDLPLLIQCQINPGSWSFQFDR